MISRDEKRRQQRREERRRYRKRYPEKCREAERRYRKRRRLRERGDSLPRKPGRKPGRSLTLRRARHQRTRLRRFGISASDFVALLQRQLGLCALCHLPLESGDGHIDHCHRTDAVRGILHRECNLLLGLARESISLLQGAIDYLTQHDATERPSTERLPRLTSQQIWMFDET